MCEGGGGVCEGAEACEVGGGMCVRGVEACV